MITNYPKETTVIKLGKQIQGHISSGVANYQIYFFSVRVSCRHNLDGRVEHRVPSIKSQQTLITLRGD